MRTIHKYPLQITDEQTIEMPVGAEILCVQRQRDLPSIWAAVETDNAIEKKVIYCRGTGHPMPEGHVSYIGTVQFHSGLVFHFFKQLL